MFPAPARIEWTPATVPGNIHFDLHRAGMIADPLTLRHEAGLEWVDDADWEYRVRFDWAPGTLHQSLTFEGLDTVAAIFLNDEELGRSDNMFLPSEFDVSGRFRPGLNELRIRFDSPIRIGWERRQAYLAAEGLPPETWWFDERAFLRKAAYMFGWDWGPRLASCGIWKPVVLREFSSRLRDVSVRQERREDGSFRVWIEANADEPVGAEFAGERRRPGEPLEFVIQEPRLWWPNGEGEQTLYPCRVFLERGEDEVAKRVGLRTIEFVRDEGAFAFRVNGRDLWARGANWIPNDSFPGRIGDEDIRAQIGRCAALEMNMLRVWGGGLYESEAFYDACDERGILVWQDFPYACGYCPENEEFLSLAQREAEHQVRRLRDRTSLALWCGNNENLAMWEQRWGGAEHHPPRYYGERLYREILPEVVSRLDPKRTYIESSPLVPGQPERSDDHYWDAWHGRGDWRFYLESQTRFASEFGFASACGLAAWKRAGVGDDADPRDEAVRWHDKTNKPVEVFESYVRLHYPKARSLEDWIYYSQLNQRDALRCAIEHYRRSESCRGALIWQFNDCWPVQSWAVQDYARLLKPAGFELARLYAPALVSIEIAGGEARVHVINDSPDYLRTALTVEGISTITGERLYASREIVEVAPGERAIQATLDLERFDATSTCLRASMEPTTPTWAFLSEPKDTRFGDPMIDLEAGEHLYVRVAGFAADLVVWDADDPGNVFDLATGQAGWRALTLANETATLGLRHAPGDLRFRRL